MEIKEKTGNYHDQISQNIQDKGLKDEDNLEPKNNKIQNIKIKLVKMI